MPRSPHSPLFPQCSRRQGASPPPGFLIRDPTQRSAPTSVGSMVLRKLSVAVVHHADHVRLDGFDKGNQLPDPLHRKSRPCRHSPWNAEWLPASSGSLIAARIASDNQRSRPALNPPGAYVIPYSRQRTLGRADPDDLLQSIIRLSHRGEQLVTGT